jgi:predicted nucleic acid-binding protein
VKNGSMKLRAGLDSSVLVDMLYVLSDRHVRSRDAYNELIDSGVEIVLTDHAILETFSVLTRRPLPMRTAPDVAERQLLDAFANVVIAPFRPGLAWETIRHTISRGFYGGRVYDASIALATYEAGARLLLTWNVKHFLTVAPAGLEIREP